MLLKHSAVRTAGIAHLRHSLEAGHICILSTGSYLDGAYGFIDAVCEEGLIPKELTDRLVITGAQIDWPSLKVIHANIANNKIKSIQSALESRGLRLNEEEVDSIAVDDPLGNDSGLCLINPKAVRVIKTPQNQSTACVLYNWDEIEAAEAKAEP